MIFWQINTEIYKIHPYFIKEAMARKPLLLFIHILSVSGTLFLLRFKHSSRFRFQEFNNF
jgi:hypothetical protein